MAKREKTVYDEVDRNKRNTFILFVFFFLVIIGLGYIMGELYGDYVLGTAIALVIAVFSMYFSYYHSHAVVIAVTGAKEADPVFYKS
ncbi:MAG TPA: hypothetical protein ENN55_02830, partial [Firmicutes bacterium]|nr:hypothetical protein [Bacillota bacterium]